MLQKEIKKNRGMLLKRIEQNWGFSNVCNRTVSPSSDNSEVTKSHPKGDDDIKFSMGWFYKWIMAIKMKLPNSMPSQANVRIVEIE